MVTKTWFRISIKSIKKLVYYYFILLLIGITISVLVLIYNVYLDSVIPLLVATTFGGIGSALSGSTIFYLRKLYKSCINLEFNEPVSSEDQIRQIGIKVYFYLRPIFSIAFSLLVQIALIINVQIITISFTNLSIGYMYMTMFLSFFAGFASGDIITYFESKSSDIISKVFNQK